jgi:putative tricarboxylic transport membrane protein
MFLASIGIDDIYGAPRFTFGSRIMETGINFVTVLIGLFAIGEVLDQLSVKKDEEGLSRLRPKTTLPRFGEIWGLRNTILRGLGIGTVIGAIPGTGATVASFVSYGVEKQVSKTPEKFGTEYGKGWPLRRHPSTPPRAGP